LWRDIWAVGARLGPETALVEHFDGGQWRVTPTPAVSGGSRLNAVDAVSANDVWAVGLRSGDNGPRTLIEHWNGRRWSAVPSPNDTNFDSNALYGVVAISANDVWAVGEKSSEFSFPLVMHWNGRAWRIVTVPEPPISDNGSALRAVTALSATNIWAVGNNRLIEHWDGRAWRIVAAPDPAPEPDTATTFLAVSARTARDIWLVGSTSDGVRVRTVTEHWDGSAWSIVASPNPSAGTNILTGVVTPPGADSVAVGYQQQGTANRTMMMQNRR
jgi:hypothetical protein